MALGEIATRDYLRNELRDLVEELARVRDAEDAPRESRGSRDPGPGRSIGQ